MKFKQRFTALVGICSVGLIVVVVLNVISYGKEYNHNDGGSPVIRPNRELNSFDGESSKTGNEGSQSYAYKLVHALDDLRHPALDIKSGRFQTATNNVSMHAIVRKLLQDKSFNSDETILGFIELGKVLEAHVKTTLNELENEEEEESEEDGNFFKSEPRKEAKPPTKEPAQIIQVQTTEKFPTFHLEPYKLQDMNKFAQKKKHEQLVAKTRMKKPLTLKIHKGTGTKLKNWQSWQNTINQYSLYEPLHHSVKGILHDLATSPITGMSTMADYGTQIKVIFKLQDGSQALFKPMRIKRDQERDPNLFYFDDFERHHAEIAAFHLDNVMQFHRVPPNSGRIVNITSTVERYASRSFKRTIYESPVGNKCFYGKCDYYCDSGHPVCGSPGREDQIEGSMAAWLPFGKGTGKKSWENPWRRSYSKFRKADWETDDAYCDTVKQTPPYDDGRRLLDLLDITIFDYLAGNQDRHHYHTFKVFGNYTSPMLYDNGRGFGFIHTDDPSILVPLVQCCQIRFSTLQRLLAYETEGPKLSERMRKSLKQDPVSSGPNGLVLSEGHLRALDRRVSKVLHTVYDCISEYGYEDVVLIDGI